MSILIEEMEMPKNCPCELVGIGYDMYCSFVHGIPARVKEYDECCKKGTRPDWCPLVEVPKPHGRLIDADALAEQMECNLWAIEDKAEKELKLGFDETLRRGMQYGHAACLNAVNDADIIFVPQIVHCCECEYNNHCLTQEFVEDASKIPFDKNTWFCADAKKRGQTE